MPNPHAGLYVVMGVSGSGKTRVGAGFAKAIGVPFIEGDDYHSPENVRRMSSGRIWRPIGGSERAAHSVR